jgi:myosin heavy subunit
MFAILIGILHVGNLRFKANEDGYAKFVCTSDAKHTLLAISSLLGINASALIESLTTSNPLAGGRDEFQRNHTLEGALDARDALAKHVYLKLFTWLVDKINRTLGFVDDNSFGAGSHHDLIRLIGILDIYGFEHFQRNSFEQLCINLANEQIQYFFNKVKIFTNFSIHFLFIRKKNCIHFIL